MANKYTALSIPNKGELEELYHNKFMSQFEVGQVYNTTQKVVYTWFKKLGIKSRKPYKRNQTGNKNSYWKGDGVTYAAFHKRVEVIRGKPELCQSCGTTNARYFEWCNLTGKYDDVFDYMRMCRPCHRKYDRFRKNSSKHVKRTAK